MEVKNCPLFFLNNKPNFSYTLIKNEFDELLKKSSQLRLAWRCFQVFFLSYKYVATFCSLIIAAVANNCPHAIYFFNSYQNRWDLARFFIKKGIIFHDFGEKLAWFYECFPEIQSGTDVVIWHWKTISFFTRVKDTNPTRVLASRRRSNVLLIKWSALAR